MFVRLVSAFGLVLTVGVARADSLQKPPSYRITRPGQVMIVTEKRRLELKQMPVKRVRQLCGPDRDSGWPSHGTVRNVTGGHQPADGMALTFMKAAAAVLAWDNAVAKRVIVKHLIRFARKGGLSRLRGEIDANTYYNLDRTLLPIIVSYSFVRDDPTLKSKDRERIEAWLDGLVRMRGPNRVVDPMRISSRNNHRYLRDSVTMAWGALIGDDALFREGIRRFTIALGQMRDDGSLPLETDRGQLALFYQRHAIASLVAIAEMAATQGYDLYTKTNSRGGRLDDMIGFLARGVTDPSVLERYTLEPQDLSFLVERGHDRHYMSWLEAYAARFPDDDNVRLLRDAMKRLGARQGERLDDYSGGMTSCFFATNSTID